MNAPRYSSQVKTNLATIVHLESIAVMISFLLQSIQWGEMTTSILNIEEWYSGRNFFRYILQCSITWRNQMIKPRCNNKSPFLNSCQEMIEASHLTIKSTIDGWNRKHENSTMYKGNQLCFNKWKHQSLSTLIHQLKSIFVYTHLQTLAPKKNCKFLYK